MKSLLQHREENTKFFSPRKSKPSIRELKQRRRQRQRKRHLKIYLYVTCATSRLFQLAQLYKNGELSRSQIGRSGVQVKKENENSPSCVHVLHKTLNLVISRCCFAEDGKEMYQNVKRKRRAIVFVH